MRRRRERSRAAAASLVQSRLLRSSLGHPPILPSSLAHGADQRLSRTTVACSVLSRLVQDPAPQQQALLLILLKR